MSWWGVKGIRQTGAPPPPSQCHLLVPSPIPHPDQDYPPDPGHKANDITPSQGLKSPHVRGPFSFSFCHLTAPSRTWALSLLPEGECLRKHWRGQREEEPERGQEQAELGSFYSIRFSVSGSGAATEDVLSAEQSTWNRGSILTLGDTPGL